MQLSGEISKVSLPNLLQLVKTGGLNGKISISQGARFATLFVADGFPVHAEVEGLSGVEALMDLFLWTSGSFAFSEEELPSDPRLHSIAADDPDNSFEKLLRDGVSYANQKNYLDELGVTARTVLKPTGSALTFAKQVMAMPGLERLDGKRTLAQALGSAGLSKREFTRTVASWLADGLASIVALSADADSDKVDLPGWVIARLKQDNPDISQAIVDMVIWVDRVKCWMYQVDADFYKIRKVLDQNTGTTSEASLPGDERDYDTAFAPPSPPSPYDSFNYPQNAPEADGKSQEKSPRRGRAGRGRRGSGSPLFPRKDREDHS